MELALWRPASADGDVWVVSAAAAARPAVAPLRAVHRLRTAGRAHVTHEAKTMEEGTTTLLL